MSSTDHYNPSLEAKAVEEERLAEERKVVRKIDTILLPILMLTLGLQYYDKAVLGSAAVFGILEDFVSDQSVTSTRTDI